MSALGRLALKGETYSKGIDSDSLSFETKASVVLASSPEEFVTSDDSTLADQISRKGAKISLKSDLQPAIPASTKQCG